MLLYHFLPVSHGSTKPSPKRKCSGENIEPPGDENQSPVESQSIASMMVNPPIDKKPPVVPTNAPPSSTPKTDTLLVVQFQSDQLKTVQLESGRLNLSPLPTSSAPSPAEAAPASPALHGNKEEPVSNLVPSAADMKSRLQKLAEQRKCWDGDGKVVYGVYLASLDEMV